VADGVFNCASERLRICEAEVETLAREGVDGVGGVADESAAGADVGGAVAETEGE